MATTDTLKGLLSGLLDGSQVPAPPADPYVLTSQLATKLNNKLDNTGDASGTGVIPNISAPTGTLAKSLGDLSGFKAPGATGYSRLGVGVPLMFDAEQI